MYLEPDQATAARMRTAYIQATTSLATEADGPGEFWGWRGRTLSGRVSAPNGAAWLRLVSAPTSKAGGKLWEGPQAAEEQIPADVPRPRLLARSTWSEDDHGYLAELYERVSENAISTDSPVLRADPKLDDAWWAALRRSLDTISAVPTTRVAVRQEYLDRAMPEQLGVTLHTNPPTWSTAHGDFHWANLTRPRLQILDWEGWGLAPAGYDAAMLHAYSLLVPSVGARIRAQLTHLLDTPAGRFAELVVITELLQTTTRGDNLDLEPFLRERLADLSVGAS